MQLSLRLILLAGAMLIIWTILRSIKKKRILMDKATGWVCLALLLLVIAVFPGAVIKISNKLGFLSPANFVFLIVTGVLVVKAFRDTAQISIMQHKIEELAQEVALMEHEAKEKDALDA